MLLVLYGATSELGRKCKDYIQSKGFEEIEKYSYAEEKPIFEERFGARKYLTKDEFYAKTDSLFRYDVANIKVGFNWEQISEAVYDNKNKLLKFTSDDVSMLRKIKEVYKEKVRIIYCYIDAVALEGLYINLPEMTAEEYGGRMAIGLSAKACYSANADLFDAVVIYGGESSIFNFKTLYQQLDAVIGSEEIIADEAAANNKHYDIFVCASRADTVGSQNNKRAEFIREMIDTLEYRGIRVCDSYSVVKSGGDFFKDVKEAICSSHVFLPIISENSLRSPAVAQELEFAVEAAKNAALIIKPISLDGAPLPECLSGYGAYGVQSENYFGSLSFIEDWFVDMFTGEATLSRLSEELDVCIKTGAIYKACELQGHYVTILGNHLRKWHIKGTVEKVNAWIKYLYLTVQLDDSRRSSTIINSLLSDITDDLDVAFYDNIASGIAVYCYAFDVSADSIYERFSKFLNISSAKQEKFFEIFDIVWKRKRQENDAVSEEGMDPTLADKIAAYSNASVELFEALFENGLAVGYCETLISAYKRVIDYCKTVSSGSAIAEKCIDRVSDLKLKSDSNVEETEIGKKTLQSLKVYLGQALPDTGNYDAFISHKSADDKLADKVYKYLKNCGFEVFCDHHTLSEMRDCNYDKRVMEALQKSKHLILIASSPDYVKSGWVHDEWHHFHSDKREGLRNGSLIMILPDELLPRKSEFPIELRDGYEIVKTSEFRKRITNMLW